MLFIQQKATQIGTAARSVRSDRDASWNAAWHPRADCLCLYLASIVTCNLSTQVLHWGELSSAIVAGIVAPVARCNHGLRLTCLVAYPEVLGTTQAPARGDK